MRSRRVEARSYDRSSSARHPPIDVHAEPPRSETPSARPATGAPAPRFLFIDGLRGVAATMVVFYHIWENLEPSVEAWFPHWIGFAFGWGNLGVEVFFVLSGFVIAHSVRNGLHTWGYLGRFALRRSIRLDPALWLTIAAETLAIVLTLRFFPAYSPELPTVGQVLANMAYVQHFLGFSDVVPVFWTLTYEVQFYLALVMALVLWRRWSPRLGLRRDAPAEAAPHRTDPPIGALPTVLLFLSCAYSAAIFVGLLPLPLQGLFFDRWFQFGTGVAVWLWFRGRIRWGALVPFFALLLVAISLAPNALRLASVSTILVTGLALAVAGSTGHFHDWLAGPVWQFLGRISYSLYLIHATVGWRFVSLARDLFGPELGVGMGLAVLVGGVALSIGCAWVMYRLVEAPTMRFARKVRLPDARRGGSPPASGFASPAAPSS